MRLTAWLNVVAATMGLVAFVVTYVRGRPVWWMLGVGVLWVLVAVGNFWLAGRQRRVKNPARHA